MNRPGIRGGSPRGGSRRSLRSLEQRLEGTREYILHMEELLQAHYDGYYTSEPSKWRRLGAIGKVDNVLKVIKKAGVERPESILEIGCGEGAVLVELGRRGLRAEGVEISASAVEACLGQGLNVGLINSAKTDFANGAFDLVLLTHVVEHLAHPRELLLEARRLGDWVVVEVPLEFHWRTPRDYRPTTLGHINTFNLKLIRHLLQSTGLRCVAQIVTNVSRDVQGFHSPGIKSNLKWAIRSAALRIAPRLAQALFTYHATIICTADDTLFLSSTR